MKFPVLHKHVHCTKRYLAHQRAAERRERSTEALAGQEKNINDNGRCQKIKLFLAALAALYLTLVTQSLTATLEF